MNACYRDSQNIVLSYLFYWFDLCFQDSEQRTFIYIKGCVPQFEKWLQDNLTVVAGIFIGIALLQVSSSVCRLPLLLIFLNFS